MSTLQLNKISTVRISTGFTVHHAALPEGQVLAEIHHPASIPLPHILEAVRMGINIQTSERITAPTHSDARDANEPGDQAGRSADKRVGTGAGGAGAGGAGGGGAGGGGGKRRQTVPA